MIRKKCGRIPKGLACKTNYRPDPSEEYPERQIAVCPKCNTWWIKEKRRSIPRTWTTHMKRLTKKIK